MIILTIIIMFLIVMLLLVSNNLWAAKSRIKQLEDIKNLQTDRLKNQTTITPKSTTTATTKTLDQETFEFVVSTNVAMQSYIVTLQEIMQANDVIYPKFIYQELLEGN